MNRRIEEEKNPPFKAQIVNRKRARKKDCQKREIKGKQIFCVNCCKNKVFVHLGDLVGSRCVFENEEGEGEIVQGKDE